MNVAHVGLAASVTHVEPHMHTLDGVINFKPPTKRLHRGLDLRPADRAGCGAGDAG